MDPQVFGTFVQVRRKELGLTQNDLAEKLNVTAKAISRWERGIGFPDIHLLEPLAEALELTLIELMQSKKIEEPVEASVISDTVTAIRHQEELSRKEKIDIAAGVAVIGGAAVFVYCLGLLYPFEARWVGGLLRFIALVGGVWGWRAYRSIITGEYLQDLWRTTNKLPRVSR